MMVFNPDALEEDEEFFICPECKKRNISYYDYNLTDGQQSEWDAGFRFCNKCDWYGQPNEILEKLHAEDYEEMVE